MIPGSTTRLVALLAATSLLIGCASDSAELTERAFYDTYCDIEEQRRFSHEEWAWRQAHAKWNLDKDVAVNLRREAHCTGEER